MAAIPPKNWIAGIPRRESAYVATIPIIDTDAFGGPPAAGLEILTMTVATYADGSIVNDPAHGDVLALVLAAPALLAACQALVAADNCNYQRDTMRHEGYFDQARAAIARATGKE